MAYLVVEDNDSIDLADTSLKNSNLIVTNDTTDGPTNYAIPTKKPNNTDDTTKLLLAPPIPIVKERQNNRKAKIVAITVLVSLIIAALMSAYFLYLNPPRNKTRDLEGTSSPTFEPTLNPTV
eukprot:UN04126